MTDCLFICFALFLFLFLFHLYNDYRGKERATPKANTKWGKKVLFPSVWFLGSAFIFVWFLGSAFSSLHLVFWKCFFPYIWFLGSAFSFLLVAGMCGKLSSVWLLRIAFCFHFWEVLFNAVWLLGYAYFSVLLLVNY